MSVKGRYKTQTRPDQTTPDDCVGSNLVGRSPTSAEGRGRRITIYTGVAVNTFGRRLTLTFDLRAQADLMNFDRCWADYLCVADHLCGADHLWVAEHLSGWLNIERRYVQNG